MSTLSPQSLSERERFDLVDVRTPAEFRVVHAQGARNVPLDQLDPAKLWSSKPADKQLVLICKSGQRASLAAQKLAAAGHPDVPVIHGGTQAWEAAGLPVNRGVANVISLERQVRIAAGALVVTGVILALTLSPWFLGLSAFVGAGLVFAGVTDTCGMGMVLYKCPWNRS
jgi:rhodanese-related sulfurtransferase